MARMLFALWALIAGPFWFSAATGGPDGLHLHALFHIVYVLFAIGAILILLRVRPATDSGLVRGVATGLVVAQAAAIVGQVGEEIAVFQHGGFSAGREVFEAPLHLVSASLTIPGLLLSQILLIVITIAGVMAMRAEQGVGAAPRHV